MYDLFIQVGRPFMQLVNISITASWLVLAVFIIRLLLKKSPKWINCLLWGIVGLRLILPFSFESVFSLIPSTATLPVENVYNADTAVSDNPFYYRIDSGVKIIDDIVDPLMMDTAGSVMRSNFSLLACIWIIGMLIMALYAFISYNRIRKNISEAAYCKENIWLCDRVETPFIIGILRPKIILPSDMSEKDRGYVIAHEKAHLKRHDHWWKPLGFLLLTVYWFNPVMWIAYVLVCRDIELACDEKVIKDRGLEDKKEYSTALINCSVPRRMISACPLAFGETGVKGRIKSVLSYKKPGFWLVAAAIIACVITALCFLTNPSVSVNDKLSVFIDTQIASHHQSVHSRNKYASLDWQVLGTEKSRGGIETTVYMWVLYQEYSFDGELKVESEAHTLTVITAREDEGGYKLSEYWTPKDGNEYESSIKERVPGRLWSKAFDSQRYITEQKKSCEAMAEDYFAPNMEKHSNLNEFIRQQVIINLGSKERNENYCCMKYAIMGEEEIKNETTLYIWVLHEEYSHETQEAVWGGNLPIAITYTMTDNIFSLVEFWQPGMGSLYDTSIKEKFPESLWDRALDTSFYGPDFEKECEQMAREYFSSLENADTSETTSVTVTDYHYAFLGKQFKGEKLIYDCGMFSSIFYTDEHMPQIYFSGMKLLTNEWPDDKLNSAWYEIGDMELFELTEENFDKLLTSEQWDEGYSAEKLRKNNKNAFLAQESEGNTLYYILEQNNGEIYAAKGYSDSKILRWIFKLGQQDGAIFYPEQTTTLLNPDNSSPVEHLAIRTEVYSDSAESTPEAYTDILSLDPLDYFSLTSSDDHLGLRIEEVGENYVTVSFTQPLISDGKRVTVHKLSFGETAEFTSSETAPMFKYILYITKSSYPSGEEQTVIFTAEETTTEPEQMKEDFYARVLRTENNEILVEPEENEAELSSSNKIYVTKNVSSDVPVPELKKGDRVHIFYDGMIAESYPAMIKGVYAIYKVDETEYEWVSYSGMTVTVKETTETGTATESYDVTENMIYSLGKSTERVFTVTDIGADYVEITFDKSVFSKGKIVTTCILRCNETMTLQPELFKGDEEYELSLKIFVADALVPKE